MSLLGLRVLAQQRPQSEPPHRSQTLANLAGWAVGLGDTATADTKVRAER